MNDSTDQVESAIARHNAGDAAALNDLFARADHRLRSIARRMLHGRFERIAALEQTDDVIQTVAVRLLHCLKDVPIATAQEFYNFSARMMRRVLIDLGRHHFGAEGSAAHRAAAPPGAGSTSAERDPSDDSTSAPDKLAAWTEFHERVEILPDELRTACDLLWYQELTQEEAARVLGVSVPTVKRRWRDAKLALLDALGGQLPGDI